MKISDFVRELKASRVTCTVKDDVLTVTGRQRVSTSLQLALLVLRPFIFDFVKDGTDVSASLSWIERKLERDWSLIQIHVLDTRRFTSAAGDDAVEDLLHEQLDSPFQKQNILEDRPELFHTATGVVVRFKKGDFREPVDRGPYAPAPPSEVDYNPPREGDTSMHRPRARRT